MAEQIIPDANALPTPEELQAMTPEQLDEAADAARTEAGDIQGRDAADLTDADVERLEALAGIVEAVDAQHTERAQAAADRQARIEQAAQRLAPVEDSEVTPEETPDEEDTPIDTPDEEVPDAELDDEAPQAVAAAGRRTPMRQPRNPRPAARAQKPLTLVAAADVPGFSSGQELDSMDQVAEAFIARAGAFPQGVATTPNIRHQLQVASIRRSFPSGLSDTNRDFSDGLALMDEAANERRLPGGSLVKAVAAAGGWCAPSEVLYDLPADETMDGIIDLPTIGISRGGINFTTGPDFSDIYTTAGFSQTEAEAIAGTTKNCVEVDCPDFSEVRLDAVGLCVKAPLLTNAAYPELVRRWITGTEVAQAHKVGARLIASMRTALGTALAPVLTGTPVTWSTLTAIELVIEGQRQAYRLSESESLEVVIPRWVRVAVRSDLANRMGIGKESVSNADIAQHFADRGAAVQWVLGYLELASPKTIIAFPATFEVMVYAAGTFVRGSASVVNLSTIYDTADLQTNVYTAAFVEDGVLLAKRKVGGVRITLPCNVSGLLSAAQLDDNWGTAQVESAGV